MSIPKLTTSAKKSKQLRDLIDDNVDILLYLDDLFGIGNDTLSKILINCLLSYTIIPCLFSSFTSSKKVGEEIILGRAQY